MTAALVAALLSWALKASLLLAAAAVGARLLRAAPAATRHALWTAAVGAALLVPVVSAVAPPLPVAIQTPRLITGLRSEPLPSSPAPVNESRDVDALGVLDDHM